MSSARATRHSFALLAAVLIAVAFAHSAAAQEPATPSPTATPAPSSTPTSSPTPPSGTPAPDEPPDDPKATKPNGIKVHAPLEVVPARAIPPAAPERDSWSSLRTAINDTMELARTLVIRARELKAKGTLTGVEARGYEAQLASLTTLASSFDDRARALEALEPATGGTNGTTVRKTDAPPDQPCKKRSQPGAQREAESTSGWTLIDKCYGALRDRDLLRQRQVAALAGHRAARRATDRHRLRDRPKLARRLRQQPRPARRPRRRRSRLAVPRRDQYLGVLEQTADRKQRAARGLGLRVPRQLHP